MKKIISSLLMLLAFTAFAQTPAASGKAGHQPKTPEERATAIASRMEKNLTLTADQKTKVHDLALAREQKMDKLREENKGKDRCAWTDQRKQAQDDYNSGMKQILTADQYKKWNDQKEERSKKQAAHRPHSTKTPEQRADTLTAQLEKSLGLTADQKTKVRGLILTREQTNDQLFEKYKGQDPCASAAERKQSRDTFETGMKATLTPEQYKKWEEQKKQHMEQRKNQKNYPHPQHKR